MEILLLIKSNPHQLSHTTQMQYQRLRPQLVLGVFGIRAWGRGLYEVCRGVGRGGGGGGGGGEGGHSNSKLFMIFLSSS